MTRSIPTFLLCVAALAFSGCATANKNDGTNSTGGQGQGQAGSGAGAAAGSGAAAAAGAGGATGGTTGTVVDPTTALPTLPKLTNVTATAVDDNVNIHFDPIDGARDYRVYVLPDDKDITATSDGHITVKNATYRCSGDRQAVRTVTDSEPDVQGLNVRTLVDGKDVGGYTRTEAEATLGYVYTTPGTGRVPVYAMGDPAANADDDCQFMDTTARWGASRAKKYVVSESERTTLLAQQWRDDGIVFYVPSTAGTTTRAVYSLYKNEWGDFYTRYYYIDGAEATLRGKSETAFQVLSATADGAVPLMRVFYQTGCGRYHDELVPGKPLFDRVRYQGDQQPVFELHYAGITADTTLVVEALADGCPYQGFFGPKSEPARDPYPQWLTLDELRAASPTGEVFINGQHDAGVNPKPIARSFVKISPGPKPDYDWFMGDGKTLGTLTETPCGVPDGNCWQQFREVSDAVDVSFMFVETDRWALAPVLGELWVSYGDVGADVNGKFRLTPKVQPKLQTDSFLHMTMTVDTFTTGRRYPQLIITDQAIPVQYSMKNGYAIVIQTFSGWPNVFQIEACDHQYWDVNNQCPAFDLHHQLDPADSTKTVGLYPHPEPGELSGLDRVTTIDAYESTKRIYLFMDGQPYGCADLPAASVPAGPVYVTYGDVLYHSGVDYTFAFTKQALQVSTRRHFDNLGFKAGVAEPNWDEKRFPCATVLK